MPKDDLNNRIMAYRLNWTSATFALMIKTRQHPESLIKAA